MIERCFPMIFIDPVENPPGIKSDSFLKVLRTPIEISYLRPGLSPTNVGPVPSWTES